MNVATPPTAATLPLPSRKPPAPPLTATVTVAVLDVRFPYISSMRTTGTVGITAPLAPATGVVETVRRDGAPATTLNIGADTVSNAEEVMTRLAPIDIEATATNCPPPAVTLCHWLSSVKSVADHVRPSTLVIALGDPLDETATNVPAPYATDRHSSVCTAARTVHATPSGLVISWSSPPTLTATNTPAPYATDVHVEVFGAICAVQVIPSVLVMTVLVMTGSLPLDATATNRPPP